MEPARWQPPRAGARLQLGTGPLDAGQIEMHLASTYLERTATEGKTRRQTGRETERRGEMGKREGKKDRHTEGNKEEKNQFDHSSRN